MIRKLTFDNFERSFSSHDGIDDLSGLTFIDSYGLVGMTLAILDAKRSEEGVRMVLPSNPATWRHLARMGFHRILDEIGDLNFDLPEVEVIDRPDVLVPIQFLRKFNEVEALSSLIWEQLRQSADSEVLAAMTEGLWEIAANSLEHSGHPAIAMGQVYSGGEPPDHYQTVQITIGDAGRGIRDSFNSTKRYLPASDREALELALKYLVSSVDDAGRGQGIATTRTEAVKLRGSFSIRSGAARFLDRAGATAMSEVRCLPGTIVGIVIPLRPGSAV